MDHNSEPKQSDELIGAYHGALRTATLRQEIRAWCIMAAGSLAIAGLFALFMALSRLPVSQDIFPWPASFFQKGLVIHVAFSSLVWFLIVFALMASLSSFYLAKDGPLRFAWTGWLGVFVGTLSFGFLFIPAFIGDTQAFLSNYIPVIEHPFFQIGLILLFIGAALPAIRLVANIRKRPAEPLDHVSFALIFASCIYFVALGSMAFALTRSYSSANISYEDLFWGGGHVFQFFNVAVMFCGWFLLVRLSRLGEDLDSSIFRLSASLLFVFVLSVPAIYAKFEDFSTTQTDAFTNLQYAFAIPVVLVAGNCFSVIVRHYRTSGSLPWSNPAFLSLVLSLAVFGVGGVFGMFVDGADTRTPAHYHGVNAGVTIAFMGVILCFFLPLLGRSPGSPAIIRKAIIMFGGGQMLACVGLFLAGGYGAARKTPGETYTLIDGAVVGMYLNGIGALFAVLGGALFVFLVLKALLRAR